MRHRLSKPYQNNPVHNPIVALPIEIVGSSIKYSYRHGFLHQDIIHFQTATEGIRN